MRKAFTAIELLIVIAIIAIVAGISIPVIRARIAEDAKHRNHGISYAIKNQPLYKVELLCKNCKKEHEVEYTAGRPVTVEHKCPYCGCRLGFVVTAVSGK